jgi:hypothetical protein
VTAALSRDVAGRVDKVNDPEIVENTKTTLKMIQHCQGKDLFLSADSTGSNRVVLLKEKNMQDPGQFWYMAPFDRYDMNPSIIINYKTCSCLQGNGPKKQDTETKLVPVPAGDVQDDLLWCESAWGNWTLFLLLHHHKQNWRLSTREDNPDGSPGKQLITKTWNQRGMMFWFPPRQAQPVLK